MFSVTFFPFSPGTPTGPGKPSAPWEETTIWPAVILPYNWNIHPFIICTCSSHLQALTAGVTWQTWNTQLSLKGGIKSGVDRTGGKKIKCVCKKGVWDDKIFSTDDAVADYFTFSPAMPADPASPKGPLCPLGPSGPSSPCIPRAPESPWQRQIGLTACFNAVGVEFVSFIYVFVLFVSACYYSVSFSSYFSFGSWETIFTLSTTTHIVINQHECSIHMLQKPLHN